MWRRTTFQIVFIVLATALFGEVTPGVPASTPGGMSGEELFHALLEIGKCPAVETVKISVCTRGCSLWWGY